MNLSLSRPHSNGSISIRGFRGNDGPGLFLSVLILHPVLPSPEKVLSSPHFLVLILKHSLCYKRVNRFLEA